MNGKVKSWNAQRGYGFITPESPRPEGRDVFVHVTQIRGGVKELVPGDRVTFDITQTEKGIAAVDVRIRK